MVRQRLRILRKQAVPVDVHQGLVSGFKGRHDRMAVELG